MAPGIEFHGTASHGGIRLDAEHQEKINYSKNFLNSKEWWEEDCDWAIPYYVFQDEIRAAGHMRENALSDAIDLIKHYHKNFKLNKEKTSCRK